MKIIVTYVAPGSAHAAILRTFDSWKGEGYYAQISEKEPTDPSSKVCYLGPFESPELANQTAKEDEDNKK